MSKDKLNRYERAFRYVRNMAQPHCESYTDFCLRTDVLVEAIQKAEKYDELQKLLTEYNVTDENIRQILLGGNQAKELIDKATPKKLKSKTDKDGRLLLVCPNCGDVYMKFWSDVETVSCRKYCDNCGQKLDWSDVDE